jgi:hypothetical protein
MRRHLIAMTLLAAGACGGSTNPTGPSTSTPSTPAPVVLGGIYAGATTDSTGSGTMTWTVSQSGPSVTAPVTAQTSLGIVTFNGSLTGNLAGARLTFTITVPIGSISGFPGCSATIDGTADDVSSTTISGTYAGTNSCAGKFTGGSFNLTKQ